MEYLSAASLAWRAALDDAGQHVGRHAGHFDRQKYHHHVVGRRHQAHAEHRSQHKAVEVRPVFQVGETGQPRQQYKQYAEEHQQRPHEDRHRVENQHPGEDFVRGAKLAARGKRNAWQGEPQRQGRAAQGQIKRRDLFKQRNDSGEQQNHDRSA